LEEFEKIFSLDFDFSNINNELNSNGIIGILNSRMKNGKTLLYLACQEGNFKLVNYLLCKQLNPSLKSKVKLKSFL